MKFIKAFLSIAFTLILIWVLQRKFETPVGPIPPLGNFLSPADGFWQNAESKNILTTTHLMLPGLTGKVTVKYDENRIPHIFAENEHDLYYAQAILPLLTAFGKWIFKPGRRLAGWPKLLAPLLWKQTATTGAWAWFLAPKKP